LYTVADLFSGAGGLTLGFVMAGFTPLFGVESDPVASATYRYNFSSAAHWEGKIEDIDLNVIEESVGSRTLNVLAAGFPCPGFSVAGQRKPEDARNQLYKQVLPFLARFKPWFVVLENVPGFVTLGNGLFARDLVADLEALGYTASLQVLEAAAYGVPQLRPRTVIVGNRFGYQNPYPSPLLEEEDYVPIEAAIDDFRDAPREPTSNHEWTRHSEEMMRRIAAVPPGGSLYPSYVDAWKRQYPGKPSMTVKENHGGCHLHPSLNRALSARELARLQSFPDSFLFEGTMKRAMFQIGNAVPPVLAKHVALALLPTLDIISAGIAEQQQTGTLSPTPSASP
jgi:DNA (cytosine-5)-methyltransferase 1